MFDNFVFYKTQTSSGPILETDYSSEALTAIKSLESNGCYVPAISRVIKNVKTVQSVPVLDENGVQKIDDHGNLVFKKVQLDKPLHTTIVEFADKTRAIVQCSEHDIPNTETAIVNAIAKRVLGVVDRKTGLVDGYGTGSLLRKLAENAFDQQAEALRVKELKAKAKAEHEAIQAAESKAAHERKIAKLTKEIHNYIEALEKAGLSNIIMFPEIQPTEKTCSCSCNKNVSDVTKSQTYHESNKQSYDTLPKKPIKKPVIKTPYVRPDKPFSQFSQAEKRAYWRAQKRGWL